jgi:hypothetical protein
MRIIDADALPNELFKKHVHDGEELEPMLYFEDAVKVVGNAHTIPAIPVEWMEKMLEKMNHAAEPYFAFFYVLSEWQNTKSIEEQQAESEMRDWQKEQEENGE